MPRRDVHFESLPEINDDVRVLLENGYDQLGNWDLAQICKHLSLVLTASVMSVPASSPWFLRTFLGPIWKRRLLRRGKLPDNVPTNKAVIPKPGGDPKRAVNQLARAIERFEESDTELSQHPLFGKLSREEWHTFHRIHAAHHLGFLVPKPPASATGR